MNGATSGRKQSSWCVAMPPDPFLVNRVVDALLACPWYASTKQRAVAALNAVFENEACADCRKPMVGPTICDVCAREKTPVLTVDRRRA